MVKGKFFRSLFFLFRSLDNLQYRAVSIENIIGGMRDHILNQKETLEVLSTFIREFEQRISSSIKSLKNYVVNSGKIETLLYLLRRLHMHYIHYNCIHIHFSEQRLLSSLSKEISQSVDVLDKERRNISHQIGNNIISSENEIVSAIDHTKDSETFL